MAKKNNDIIWYAAGGIAIWYFFFNKPAAPSSGTNMALLPGQTVTTSPATTNPGTGLVSSLTNAVTSLFAKPLQTAPTPGITVTPLSAVSTTVIPDETYDWSQDTSNGSMQLMQLSGRGNGYMIEEWEMPYNG